MLVVGMETSEGSFVIGLPMVELVGRKQGDLMNTRLVA